MGITLAEEIMLLSLDDESGATRQRQAVGWAVAGGILLELVLAERVSVKGKYLELADDTPTGEELLDGRLRLIGTWLRGRSKRRVTDWLTKDQAKAVGAAVERLRARGIVVVEESKVLGVFPRRRYPEADGAAERALRERLAAAVLTGAEPDERTAGLVALLHAAKLHRLAFPDLPRGQVTPRMAEIAAGQWAAERVRAAIRDMQAAMAAVTVVTVAAVS
ncbi:MULTISPECIES: GPP34 family phosphoprotein [unclassified Streptomyces]|uniref:GOLPH3/VPS74 family protein n=1 Tax=unclassified Streptomyces TaxID=2593676 RepID=UPI0022563769|nr:GPP34 family phosphoprotein [Streptomyces sp. NBC_00047]MCX5611158.1 GPP34 family phosphoprotein [Streptomyces sp. NBC_00047]